jgi:hypothetical protein
LVFTSFQQFIAELNRVESDKDADLGAKIGIRKKQT